MSTTVAEERGGGDGREEYTEDGTVDLKGRPILRSKTGRWRACSFIVGYEVFERMAYYGIASNLVLYLKRELHEGTVKSANNVTNWVGTVWMAPILGAYIADAHLGRSELKGLQGSKLVQGDLTQGMGLLTLAVSLPALKPPSCGHGVKDEDCDKRASTFQVAIFYLALYIIAAGTGGTKPNISTMGADQFDDFQPKERIQKLSFFNWWMFSIFFGTLFSNTFLVYIQDTGWVEPWLWPSHTWAGNFSLGVLRRGRWMSQMTQKSFIELNLDEYAKSRTFRIDHTPSLRLLDKAAVKSGPTSPWMLCPVTQVEETKQMIKMIPILVSTFLPSTMLVQRIGIGIVLQIIVMVTACLAEMRRLRVARENGIFGKTQTVPLTIFILLPQFALMGIADTFVEVAKIEFFYDQAPQGMKSLGTSYFTTSLGVGSFLSSFLLSTVSDITKKHGQGWIENNLNVSHLDYFYAFYAILSFVNFLFFLVVASSMFIMWMWT
ncbi:Protein NRT1/ PTR family 5.1 [Vitis vinifera]|uniref:Protein NRT1/ PTR family 5.1 n=1 Tax=Vitis vinifera TaxID=29760 RepID=A0A438KDQ7_VITVI|nr:Protein NRT1/ PTR family 5.1 [Vitis vinifera]